MTKVANLYNQLFRFENILKMDKIYYIHKKLKVIDNKYKDIYDYLIATIDIKNKLILDAGCGVGKGCFNFYHHGAYKIDGISISINEIERALKILNQKKITSINFILAEFSKITKNKYDLIFCIESFKHSFDFKKDLLSLLNGLRDNGSLIIVDDFFDSSFKGCISQKLCNCWELKELLYLSEFSKLGTNYIVEIKDLTSMVNITKIWLLNWKLSIIKCLNKKSFLRKLVEGGIYLDMLYYKNKMKYCIVKITKLKNEY